MVPGGLTLGSEFSKTCFYTFLVGGWNCFSLVIECVVHSQAKQYYMIKRGLNSFFTFNE